jgi:hypothetical protein
MRGAASAQHLRWRRDDVPQEAKVHVDAARKKERSNSIQA